MVSGSALRLAIHRLVGRIFDLLAVPRVDNDRAIEGLHGASKLREASHPAGKKHVRYLMQDP